MATSVTNFKMTSHSRSISLPTSSPSLLATAEGHLWRLKSSQDASSSLSHPTTCHNLDGLRNLYECLNDLFQLPLSHQHLSNERNDTFEEEILDGSLKLLDICGTARDVYSFMKESVQELESSLRRRRGGDMDTEIDAYMISKKKLNRMICKCFKELKRSEKNCSRTAVNSDSALPFVNLIKQAEEIGLRVLESSLSFLSGAKHLSRSKSGAWSLVSKLLQSKGESDISEIEKFETEFMVVNSKKSRSNNDGDTVRTQNLLKELGAVSSNIEEVAEHLELTFRLFLKARVSLLNVLNH